MEQEKTMNQYEEQMEQEKDIFLEHAKSEMEIAWGKDLDEMQQLVKENVMELLEVFSKQKHSGMSSPYVLGVFDQLAKLKPLTPLTGEDWEWNEIDVDESSDENSAKITHQNKRDSRVFKFSDGSVVFNDGKIFRNPDGTRFHSSKYSPVVVSSFPFTPETEYVNLDEDEELAMLGSE